MTEQSEILPNKNIKQTV